MAFKKSCKNWTNASTSFLIGAWVRISDFSKITTLGNWSADILVRSRRSVNPEADRNVRAGFDEFCLALLSSRSSGSARWETRQVGDAKGVIHTSPGQRPGFISTKTHQR